MLNPLKNHHFPVTSKQWEINILPNKFWKTLLFLKNRSTRRHVTPIFSRATNPDKYQKNKYQIF